MDERDDFLRHFLKHESDLRAFIGSLVPDPTLREDVFQDVALTLWKQLSSYDPTRSYGAWARGIAANKILQQRTQNARFPRTFSPEVIQSVLDAFERTETDDMGKVEALRACLQRLPGRSRQLLDYRYDEGLSMGAIAGKTGRTLDAVYQALSRIRLALEDCIRQRLAPERGAAR